MSAHQFKTLTAEQREVWKAHRWSSPTYAAMCTEVVDALLAHVWQGKKRRLRDHMLGVCAKVSRHWDKPWIDQELARAWEAGFMDAAGQDHPAFPRTRRFENPYSP
ncbi:hypothetical protein GUY44_12130 [Pimelobacter simplex]|uniref:hypothetical protein n=1 Tax=Nocardioides simplex TaxID=2045 RepID=UPI000535C8A5|nr:hypothetical protein [Pimelobacter simplex]MCG8151231.1 hypothetical protein [Pimelobacter simplex]GEB17173.1 hypothetical protein NSI01_54880 [Pimelobacter simplex]SFN19132.1 hypothetical protein SAMN05421671_0047 [Pimelobacter simplex]